MNEETFGALKRVIEEVEQKRKGECAMKDCIVNNMIGGNDIDLVKSWIIEEYKKVGEENKEEYKKVGEENKIDYKCPHCEAKQTSVIEWIVQSIGHEFDLRQGKFVKVIEGDSEYDSFACPECRDNLPKELIEKLELWDRI